jgi:hypothetical protein
VILPYTFHKLNGSNNMPHWRMTSLVMNSGYGFASMQSSKLPHLGKSPHKQAPAALHNIVIKNNFLDHTVKSPERPAA